jgi:PadR family transcriptional regulator, regulatory protein PadR
MIGANLKRGSAELAILTVLEAEPLHGYEIAKRISQQTGGVLTFQVASLYPMLYSLAKRGWIAGEWEKKSERTDPSGPLRRFYRLTPLGRKKLAPLKREWKVFFQALDRLAGVNNA